eukprot:m.72318 g.72318  ORF g.72318 m.72318 type:complete len:1070 (-) comp8378_c0_seq1:1663-4872(-)
MGLTPDQAQKLLDFEQESIDVNVLDTIVKFFYEGRPGCSEQKMAEEIMKEFQAHEDAWRRVSQILQESQYPHTKHLALNILKTAVNTRWKLFPEEEREGIKNFVVSMTIEMSESFEVIQENQFLLSKLNGVLVSIVIKTWPHAWDSFIVDIVNASMTSEPLCQNNMEILKLLSEEIFDFSRNTMVQVKIQHLKDQMCKEYEQIHNLISTVLQNSEEVSLINQALQTLLRFLSWIPIAYVFNSSLIDTLINRLFNVDVFRSNTLECLAEIGALPGDALGDLSADMLAVLQEQQVKLLTDVVSQLEEMLPPDTDISSVWNESSLEDQGFVKTLSLFLTSWLKQHGHVLENDESLHGLLHAAINYVVLMSNVDDTELFKICVEYWRHLAQAVYSGDPKPGLGNRSNILQRCYSDILSTGRSIVITHMAKPEEVLVVEKDGETVREFQKDTDTIELYNTMRTTLVFLCHIDTEDTISIMQSILASIVSGKCYSWKNLNTLCWAVGSISGALTVDQEKKFLVDVIRELLQLCEEKRGKHHKAIIASNIMYVVGQYPRFLKMHWRFLRTVVTKLFEFMHEEHEGVKDMACDTFMKIAKKCKDEFVIRQNSSDPFIEYIIQNLQHVTCDLANQQKQTFYRAAGEIVSAQRDAEKKAQLVTDLLSVQVNTWTLIMQEDSFENEDLLAECVQMLRCETAVCEPVGEDFGDFLQLQFDDLIGMYKVISQIMSDAFEQHGEAVSNQSVIRLMRVTRTEMLKLITMWMSKARNVEPIIESFVPPLLEAILVDYSNGHPFARNHEVLQTLATIVSKFKKRLDVYIMDIFGNVFEATLDMIKDDFTTFPEHRRPFYALLLAICEHCFGALGALSMEQWKMVIDAIVWGFQHPLHAISDLALKALRELLKNVSLEGGDFFQEFSSNFFLDIMESVFAVATDSSYISGMNYHSVLLASMFEMAEKGVIQAPLNSSQQPGQRTKDFLLEYVGNLLKNGFPHLQDDQLIVIVEGFFAYDKDPAKFKQHLRDFLVQCKEFNGEDLADLYLEERKQQVDNAQQEKMKSLERIPGMLNPYQKSQQKAFSD